MAFSINRAVILGNISQEPDLRYTPDGTAVCNFSVATNHSVKKGETWEDVPTFHSVTVWRGKAEFIARECHKGDKVYVEGRLQTRSWEDENKIRKYKTEIIADEVIPMNKRGGSSNPDTVSEKEPEDLDNTPLGKAMDEEIDIDEVLKDLGDNDITGEDESEEVSPDDIPF